MQNKERFEYTLELVNSIPEDIVSKSSKWRKLRQDLNKLLEPDNKGSFLKVSLGSFEDTEKAQRALRVVRDAAYSWGYSAHIGSMGKKLVTAISKLETLDDVTLYVWIEQKA